MNEWAEAYSLGEDCCRRARTLGGPMHIRRHTDTEARTPFDCYHYRIIYQTYHGMKDVLGRLHHLPGTAVLPFQYRKLRGATRVVVESCPGSTLKRLNLPHQNYKQPAGSPLTPRRLRTRKIILDSLTAHIEIGPSHRRTIIRNAGGDALDAVIAAVGAWQSFRSTDHTAIERHARYRREGRLFI